MTLSRRRALGMFAASAPALQLASAWQDGAPEIPPGPFKGTRESLKSYQVPEWFRDAKFGIWAHWGPQSSAEAGDWYAWSGPTSKSRNRVRRRHMLVTPDLFSRSLIRRKSGDQPSTLSSAE